MLLNKKSSKALLVGTSTLMAGMNITAKIIKNGAGTHIFMDASGPE